MNNQPILPLLRAGDPFPPVARAWPRGSPAPGLLAVGGALDVNTLRRAYGAAIFPWFSAGEPLLWWSPDPRMVLRVEQFKLHHSLRKTLRRFLAEPRCEVRFDSAFHSVINSCARKLRPAQSGTWIVPKMRAAYEALHAAGQAHSVETWVDDRLVGGLYCVNVGRAVFGESMFADVTDGSKIALAALVAWCRYHAIPLIDCQQNTRHLASLGAREEARAGFVTEIAGLALQPAPPWQFDVDCWDTLALHATQSP